MTFSVALNKAQARRAINAPYEASSGVPPSFIYRCLLLARMVEHQLHAEFCFNLTFQYRTLIADEFLQDQDC